MPPPPVPRFIGRTLFDWIRNEDTIYEYLNVAYSRNTAFANEDLIQRIRECTEGDGGHAAFASILWSPPAITNDDNRRRYRIKLDFCSILMKFKRKQSML